MHNTMLRHGGVLIYICAMPSDFHAALQATNDAINRRAFKEAEVPFRTLLAGEPHNVDALRLLAQLLRSLDKHGDALPFLERLALVQPTADHFLLLYSCQAELRRFEEAEASLEEALKHQQSPDVRLGLVKMKKINGKNAEAADLVTATYSAFPNHVPTILARAGDLFERDPTAALAVLESGLAPPAVPAERKIDLLRAITEYRSTTALRLSTQFGDAAADWDELMHWPDHDGLARFERAQIEAGTDEKQASLNLALIALARQDWQSADAHFKSAADAKVPSIVDVVACDEAFYHGLEGMSDEDIFKEFPALEILKPPPARGIATVFLASDLTYFHRFTLPLLQQFSDAATSPRIHVHLLDGDPEEWGRCLEAAEAFSNIALSMSAEASGMSVRRRALAAIYYHAIRFVRLYQYVKTFGEGAYLLDVDAALRGDPGDLLRALSQFDVAVCGRTHTLEPWKKILGCCVGISPSGNGLFFARLAAAYIAYWHARGIHRWGVDQAALFGAYAAMVRAQHPPRTYFLPPTLVSLNNATPGVLDFISGHKKFAAKAG